MVFGDTFQLLPVLLHLLFHPILNNPSDHPFYNLFIKTIDYY